MSCGPVSINIGDHEWEQRMNRLRTLESVKGPQRRVEFTCLASVYTAAKEGDLDKFIRALEEYSAAETASLYYIISTKGPFGNSLLHIAAGIENANILRALLEVIPDGQLAARANNRGDTALHIAARAGRISTARLLLDRGSDVDIENEAGNRALHEAVKNGHYDLSNLLLQGSSISVNKKNNEGKCPLFLAVETGNLDILSDLLKVMDENELMDENEEAVDENEILSSKIEGMSPVHGAVMHQRLDMLKEMSEQKKELFDLIDDEGDTPLHLAAHENYVEGVEFLVDKFSLSAFQHNYEGCLPIHVACQMGHLETIKKLLRHWPDPEELLTSYGRKNILHVAAKYGMASVVKYILGDPKLEKLINAKDKNGNTPLHVATKEWQPAVLLPLTRDKRVDLKLVNHSNLTALDIVDVQLREIDAPLRKSLTRTVLVSAGAPRSKDKAIRWPKSLGPWRDRELPDLDTLKDLASTRMVVATLVATVTFAAGFSVPGGYKGSEPDAGMATLLNKPMYDVFVICNSVAMYNSIIAVVILVWTQINDPRAVFHALGMARLPLLIALATMSMAFTAGVYVTISKRTWIAVFTLIVGITALFVILILYIALFVPLAYKCRLVQLFADYIIGAAISISSGATREAFRERSFPTGIILKRMDLGPDMLKEMSEQKKEPFDLIDDEGDTPLHLAARENYVEGVEFLVDKFSLSAFQHNDEGCLPIHVACQMGHLETIKKLLRHWPDPEELLTSYGRKNILHVAAKYGRASVVKYILGDPKLEKLINAKDKDGNTPLHVATKEWQPAVLLPLTRDKRVDLKLVNHSNLTALDIVDVQLREIDAPLRKSLTRTVLVSAGAPRSKDKAIRWPKSLGPWRDRELPDLDTLGGVASIRVLVAALVTTVTFAAGFSVPGGYKGSEPDAGIATLLNKPMYDVFVICNSVAMYSSIIAVAILLWTQINDSYAVFHALGMARLPLLIALATMSMAFMAEVYVTISKRTWLAVVTLIIGITALFVILILYIALFVPLAYKCRLVQLFADYIIGAATSISRSATGEAFRDPTAIQLKKP